MSGSPVPQNATDATPRLLILLALALIPAFAVTTAVTRAFRAEQRRLAADWFERGSEALDSGRPEEAIEALRTALTFSREDRQFRLRLAQALAADGRTAEARAYLLTLRESQPGNGPVNLELARLAAAAGSASDASRFYHAAIEGAWADTAEAQRRAIRLELARFLLASGSRLSAQSELIALAGDLPPEPDLQMTVAGLMLEAGLARRAQSIYEVQLNANPRHPAALAGAGRAAFETGDFIAAERQLERAMAAGVDDPEVTSALATTRLIATLDPYRRRLPLRQRAGRAMQALAITETRLANCPAAFDEGRRAALGAAIESHRAALASAATRDLDAIDAAMDLVFQIQSITANVCGEPDGADRALLLLGRQRGGGDS